MNLKIWFILNEGQVTGPFEPEEVETKAAALEKAQIWGRGHAEWMTLGRWRQILRESSSIHKSEDESQPLWRVRVEGSEKSPMKYSDLIAYLKSLKDLSLVDLNFKDSGWKEIFSFAKVTENLGISRRSHPRVPIVGTFSGKKGTSDFSYRVISISEGGLGLNDAQNLQIGTQLSGILTSPNLYVTITATAEVVYVGSDGYVGMRFAGLPEEFKGSIIEYVNKFAST